MRSICCVLLLVLCANCAASPQLPLTASDLGQRVDGAALVAYLGQPDASAAVCDLRTSREKPGAQAAASTPDEVRDALLDGLGDGKIAPALWSACVDRMVRTADRPGATRLLDRVVETEDRALADPKVETDRALQERVDAMEAVFLDGPPDRRADPDVTETLLSHVRYAIIEGRFGAWAVRHGTALIDVGDIERGHLRGEIVDGSVLNQLREKGDDTLLFRCSQRLPDAGLRSEARRQVIRLRISASSDPALRANAAAVEEAVMKYGVNRVSTSEHAPVRARLSLPLRQVWIRQQVLARTVTLLGSAPGRTGLSVLPELPLRRTLQVDLDGLSRPVTVCGPATALDPEPCIGAESITVGSPLVTMDAGAVLHVTDRTTVTNVIPLAKDAQHLTLPISVGGQRLVALDWPLAFEKPADLVLHGRAPAPGTGPDLKVRVERSASGRLVQTVRAGAETYIAVVERADAARFHVVSRGADGSSGTDGLAGFDGSSGLSGANASCPSMAGQSGADGGDGSPGGNGGDGDGGGNGGAIQVEISCGGGGGCDDLAALLKTTIVSVGGQGGAGGSGGRGGGGGRGGSGGSGTTCTTDPGTDTLSGGSDGRSGSDGTRGRDGSAGAPGSPGPVTVRVVP